ncbi:transposase [Gracilimonas sp. Q87]|uniref:transposase n=1 Tax=Gracilimonas sp. Q87 TaxID=3384766 RepID=UPI003983E291
MSKFWGKYRLKSNRWEYWDYKKPGAYFITICTKHRQHFFGKIEGGEMNLNEVGSIAKTEWKKTPKIRKDMNITLGEYVIMPDHMHGIIIIGNNEYNTREKQSTPGRDAMHRVSTWGDIESGSQKRFGPQRKNLASIIRGYKSSVTIQGRKINPEFCWQSNYHDRVIRNYQEYQVIAEYILDNVRRWKLKVK